MARARYLGAAPGAMVAPNGPGQGQDDKAKTVPDQYLGLESWNNLPISAGIRLKTNTGNYAALSINQWAPIFFSVAACVAFVSSRCA